MNDIGGDHQSGNRGQSAIETDLAAMSKSIFIIGDKPIAEIKPAGARRLWVRYNDGNDIVNRGYDSASTWRHRVRFSLLSGKPIEVLEMDEWGRLGALFPKEVAVRLAWNATHDGDVKPVARLFDPNGPAEILLIRGRLGGHAVDVLHNLTDGGPVLQALWIADIMRLNPLLGIRFVRDDTFTATPPISELIR